MSYYNNTRDEVLRYVPGRPNRVLDIGCGAGAFGELLKHQYNCEVTGIELVNKAAQLAESKLDRVYAEKLETLVREGVLKREFDLIVLNDVIEHMEDPSAFLNCLKAVVTKEGCVIASVPNFIYVDNILGILLNKDFEYTDSGILDKTHLRFFTKKSINRLFNSSGYRVDLIEPLNFNTTFKWRFMNLVTLGWIKEFTVYQYIVRAMVQ